MIDVGGLDEDAACMMRRWLILWHEIQLGTVTLERRARAAENIERNDSIDEEAA